MPVWAILGLVMVILFVLYAFITASSRSDEQADQMFERWQREHQQNETVGEPQHEDAPKDEDVPNDTDLPQDKDLPDGQ